jgi:hypothetical protein
MDSVELGHGGTGGHVMVSRGALTSPNRRTELRNGATRGGSDMGTGVADDNGTRGGPPLVLKTGQGGRLDVPDNHADVRNPRLGGDSNMVRTLVCKCSPALRSVERASNPPCRRVRGVKSMSSADS